MGRFICPWCSAGALRARSSAIMMLSMSKPFPSRLTIHTSKGKPRGLVLLLFPWVDKQHSGANPHSDATRKKFFIRTLSAVLFFASHQNFGVALQCGAHLEMSHTSLFRDCCWLVAAVSSELQVRYVASQFVFSFFYPWFVWGEAAILHRLHHSLVSPEDKTLILRAHCRIFWGRFYGKVCNLTKPCFMRQNSDSSL